MSDKRAELWLLGSQLVIAMAGLAMKGVHASPAGTAWGMLLSPSFGDLLLIFGGVGSVGVLFSLLFGLANIERPLFWLFLLSIVGAALRFTFTG